MGLPLLNKCPVYSATRPQLLQLTFCFVCLQLIGWPTCHKNFFSLNFSSLQRSLCIKALKPLEDFFGIEREKGELYLVTYDDIKLKKEKEEEKDGKKAAVPFSYSYMPLLEERVSEAKTLF